ncbi:MAG: cellulase, partial [Sphingobacteriaceae bacterium]
MKFFYPKNNLVKTVCLVWITVFISINLSAQSQTPIAVNQIGFLPDAPKVAIISGKTSGKFSIKNADGKVVFSGDLQATGKTDFSGIKTASANFSALHQTGNFVVSAEGLHDSYPFEIEPNVYADAAKASIKAFYFQRASTALPEKFAGKWHRVAGHPD